MSAGATVTLTVQINAQGFATSGLGGFGAEAPGGMVSFTAGGVTLGNAVVTQNAYPAFNTDSGLVNFSFPASQLSVGNNIITASYSGDRNYQPSTSTPIGVYVTGSSLGLSTTALGLSSASVAPGDSFVFSAAVSPNRPLATGTVVFLSDGQVVSKPLSLSHGKVSASSQDITIAPGAHLITALYSGDTTYQASVSAPASFTIGAAALPSIATINVSPATVEQGTAVIVTTTISPASPVPGGTVQLLLDGDLYGQAVPLTGTTNTLPLLTNTLQSGTHALQVNYSGDNNHSASTSAAATLTVLDPVGTFTLSPSTASTSMTQGKSASAITLTVAPAGGFHSVIMFACTGGLPSWATCLFAPASITPTDSNPETTVLTISSIALTSRTVESSTSRGLVWGAACAGLIVFMLPRRSTRRWSVFALLLALSTLGVLSGCGSGGVDPNAVKPLSTGSYSVSVRATGGSTIQTATVTLTIQ